MKQSAPQILARDYNWRQGNLRRLLINSNAMDSDLAQAMRNLVTEQMDRERFRYEAGQMALKSGNPSGYMDEHLSKALLQAERNRQ